MSGLGGWLRSLGYKCCVPAKIGRENKCAPKCEKMKGILARLKLQETWGVLNSSLHVHVRRAPKRSCRVYVDPGTYGRKEHENPLEEHLARAKNFL